MEEEKELIKIMMQINRLLRELKENQDRMQIQINYLFSKIDIAYEPNFKD